MTGRPVSDLYVYYRVAPGGENGARRAVRRLLETLAGATGVTGTLHRHADDPLTWMEVYRDVADTDRFLSALSVAVEESGIGAHLDGVRHVEHFIPCA